MAAERLRSPVWWFGGKGKMTARIVPLLPPHREYVEPFGGGASVLLAKRPAKVETWNDRDGGLAGFFRVLCDPGQFKAFRRLVEAHPYSRELWNEARASWEAEADPVRRAALWFVVARQSFGGCFGAGWGSAVERSRAGMAGTASQWLSCLRGLPAIHARLVRVQIENADFRTILKRYDGPGYLAYCDPPYVHATRRAGGYAHEMTEADHAEFVERLLAYRGAVVLSGYAHEVYRPLAEAGWERRDFETACYAAARTRATGILGAGAALRKQARTESVWRNPEALRRCRRRDEPLYAAAESGSDGGDG